MKAFFRDAGTGFAPPFAPTPVGDRHRLRLTTGVVNENRYPLQKLQRAACTFNRYTFRMSLSPEQCRAARGLLAWSQDQLAERAGVGNSTVSDFEKRRRVPTTEYLITVRNALEDAGVIFESDSRFVGVKLRVKRGK